MIILMRKVAPLKRTKKRSSRRLLSNLRKPNSSVDRRSLFRSRCRLRTR